MLQWKGKSKNPPEECEFYLSEVFQPLFLSDLENIDKSDTIKLKNSKKNADRDFSKSVSDAFEHFNLLIHGDNVQVLQFLGKNLNSPVDLIYIDPPFMKNVSFFRHTYLRGIDKDVSYKQKQYSDIWDLDTYLQFLYERFHLLKDLLSETGSIYVHLDEDAAHYIKVILDEVFGKENFRRQIIWNTASLNVAGFKGQVRDNYIYASGIILFYTKTDSYTFNPQYSPHSQEYFDKKYKKSDENGKYRITRRNNKIYMKEDQGEPITNIWNDILSFNYAKAATRESVFYPTQKPEALLERIIRSSSNPGDIVLDCFSGSGTTAAVAQKLDRRWITCDTNSNAIHTSSKRLQRLITSEISIGTARSFQIWRNNISDTLNNPIRLKVERNEDNTTVRIVTVDENLVYQNAHEKQKMIHPPKFALIDSVLISFSSESANSQPFIIQFSDIPRGRRESVKGEYKFSLPKSMKGPLSIAIWIYDIFGNCYCRKLDI
ncbi:MAG: DNA methyltransferase [Promethearchaeota archaeon]